MADTETPREGMPPGEPGDPCIPPDATVGVPPATLMRMLEAMELSHNHLMYAVKNGAFCQLDVRQQIPVLSNVLELEEACRAGRTLLEGGT